MISPLFVLEGLRAGTAIDDRRVVPLAVIVFVPATFTVVVAAVVVAAVIATTILITIILAAVGRRGTAARGTRAAAATVAVAARRATRAVAVRATTRGRAALRTPGRRRGMLGPLDAKARAFKVLTMHLVVRIIGIAGGTEFDEGVAGGGRC